MIREWESLVMKNKQTRETKRIARYTNTREERKKGEAAEKTRRKRKRRKKRRLERIHLTNNANISRRMHHGEPTGPEKGGCGRIGKTRVFLLPLAGRRRRLRSGQ